MARCRSDRSRVSLVKRFARSWNFVRSRWGTLVGLSVLALLFSVLPGGYSVNLREMVLSYGCPLPVVDVYLDTPDASEWQWRWHGLPLNWLGWMILLSMGAAAGATLCKQQKWRWRPRLMFTFLAPLALLWYAHFYRSVWPVFVSVYWLDRA